MEQACCRETAEPSREIVLCEGEVARTSHKELFRMDDAWYVMAEGDLLSAAGAAVTPDLARLHIAAGWESVLRVALWSSRRPPLHDVLGLLKKCGVGDAELAPFRAADISDIFPWLYYGKRFETLRKLCNRAKAKAEVMLGQKKLLVYCHLVAEDTGRIVASSL